MAVRIVTIACLLSAFCCARVCKGNDGDPVSNTESRILNLSKLHAAIDVLLPNPKNIEFRLRASRDVTIGDLCHSWHVSCPATWRSVAQHNYDINDSQGSRKLSQTTGGLNFMTSDEVMELARQFNIGNTECCAIDTNGICRGCVYVTSVWLPDSIYEVPPGENACSLQFDLTAKCGFMDAAGKPHYPDTLWEGRLSKEFRFYCSSGEIHLK